MYRSIKKAPDDAGTSSRALQSMIAMRTLVLYHKNEVKNKGVYPFV